MSKDYVRVSIRTNPCLVCKYGGHLWIPILSDTHSQLITPESINYCPPLTQKGVSDD